MTDDPTAPPPRTSAARTGDAPLDDSGDPELEQALAGEEVEDEGDDESDEDDDGTDPLAGPVPEPPPPHDEKEPEPVPPTLWESDADHLDPTAPVPRDHAPDIDPEKLDPDALKVVNRLLQYGHQAYLVGGCVRDLLAGRTPKDFDVATSAVPSEVRAIFRNCRLIGRRFRLAHVYFKGGKIVEVSTFRANPSELEDAVEHGAEGEEKDDLLISDDNVFGTAEQDARRRDFTINGLFYDVAEGRVIDYVARARGTCVSREIRTIGDPEIRMREDPVRILRAVRFACKLEFDIESRTYAAMEGAVEDLPRCAPPRLLEETFRLIRGGVARRSAAAALRARRAEVPAAAGGRLAEGARRRGSSAPPAHAERLDAPRAFGRGARGLGAPRNAAAPAAAFPAACGSSRSGNRDPGRAPPRHPPMRKRPAPPSRRRSRTCSQELVRTARLPRRIAERCRMILLAQATLSGQRRRRGGLASFRRHPLFQEALTVFEISVEATGEHRAELEAWKAGGAPTPPVRGSAPEGGRRRRRRRRRGPRAGSPPGAGS